MHKKIHQSGMSLIELLVALGISSIVALGLAMALDNMTQGQKRVSLVASLTEKKSYFQSILNAENTFSNTIAATVNNNMQCLRDKTTCSASYVASAYSATLDQITLYNNAPAPGAPLHNGRVTSNKGFTEKGAECTGFSATGPGNDDCPVGYIINWYLSNTGATEGISLTITAKMVFNPSDNHKLKKLINANLNTPLGAYDAQATKNIRNFVNYTVPTCNLSGISLNNGSSYPFYQTSSVPTGSRCISEFRNCTIFNNNPQLSGSYTNATCVQNCSGSWGACSVACGGGTQTYTVSVPANQWGAACPAADGATQACNTAACGPPVNCVGSWGACSAACGGGTQTYTISTPASGGGSACPAANGATQACNTQACICYELVPQEHTDCIYEIDFATRNCGSGPEPGPYAFSPNPSSPSCFEPMNYYGCAYTGCSTKRYPTCTTYTQVQVPCP